MADAVTTRVQVNGARNYEATFTNISDGTGESAVVKIDKSTLVNELGLEPDTLSIVRVSWSIQGFTSVRILFDHTTDDVVFICAAGNGYWEETMQGGPIRDPDTTGGTGDILFTTAGAVSGATYTITLQVRKVGSV
jgi:hypothetical protein